MTTPTFTSATLYQVATFFQAMSLASVLDAEPAAEGHARILLVTNSGEYPEITPSVAEIPGFAALESTFDRVIDFNATIWPHHPRAYYVDDTQAPFTEAAFRSLWGLDGVEVSLCLAWTPTLPPGFTLARVFADSPISVHFDGLMSFGPLPGNLPEEFLDRFTGVTYLDIVPGVRPTLLPSEDLHHHVHPVGALRAVVEKVAAEVPAEEFAAVPESGAALLVGQYVANLGLISHADEIAMHVAMAERAAAIGARSVVFKPHPSSPMGLVGEVEAAARTNGLDFHLLDTAVPVEVFLARVTPTAVISCYSTALTTADRVFGVPVEAVWTDRVLEALAPYENSNRIPLTLIDLQYGQGASAAEDGVHAEVTDAERGDLVTAIAYCMQPILCRAHRETAEAFLAAHYPRFARYFKRRRLTRLDLPGRLPPKAPAPIRKVGLLRRVARRVRRVSRRRR
ncbi:polysialyltransferase family glycosyltransferase [Brevibacterium litoralis]|uniref:polysialyltransferase family glycosyltransferase n=1 Tax=Brevibacterium litoralis TaxID=3138935 RepID=UPI0032ECF07B